MAARAVIPFFTDNDVPDSVGDVIAAAGHKLTRLRDAMLTDSADPVVAAACREHGQVLVTHNWKDFRKILKADAAVSVTNPSKKLNSAERRGSRPAK